ncbi:methyltransferase domain-containing protein [Micromonospora sp. CPCC 205371]|nr:methyltransferase domain-containing protein [Micromonospora sp. CPCC 205371]
MSGANPVRGRLNAAVLRATDGYAHLVLGAAKRALLADLPDRVLEIGPGTGANMRYYRPGTRVVAVEPNQHMHAGLAAAARRRGIVLELRAESAESIGLPDGSVEAVVCTLVLCTVPDPAAVVREIARVLRPGGRLYFLEHVLAADHAGYRAVQRAAARPWRWFFEGCDVLRDTERVLARAGFADLVVDRYRARTLFVPINPQIAGVATR